MNLKRTQVYFEKVYHEALKQEAKASNISMSELIRRIVKEHLVSGRRMTKFDKDEYMSLVGLGKSGVKDTSLRHDECFGEAVADGHSN